MTLLLSYLRLLPLLVGLTIGIQVPAFVDQYARIANAHLSEVQQNFAEFQRLADKYFAGDIQQLIAHHLNSVDPVFNEEGLAIQGLHQRLLHLDAEVAAVSGTRWRSLAHLLREPDLPLLGEARASYRAVIPLQSEALSWGLTLALVHAILFESLCALWRLRRRKRELSSSPPSLFS